MFELRLLPDGAASVDVLATAYEFEMAQSDFSYERYIERNPKQAKRSKRPLPYGRTRSTRRSEAIESSASAQNLYAALTNGRSKPSRFYMACCRNLLIADRLLRRKLLLLKHGTIEVAPSGSPG
jgi:hypothetical protein